jgi:hypothetical protein
VLQTLRDEWHGEKIPVASSGGGENENSATGLAEKSTQLRPISMVWLGLIHDRAESLTLVILKRFLLRFGGPFSITKVFESVFI